MIHPMTYAGMEAPTIGASSSAYFLDRLIAKASVIFELRKEQIMSKSRKREIVMARQAVMYVARKRLSNKLEYIAKYFGKNHGTVIHACKQVENLTEFDDDYNKKVTALYRIL
jgi:ATPase involved in DNA replication initiation